MICPASIPVGGDKLEIMMGSELKGLTNPLPRSSLGRVLVEIFVYP